MIGLDTGHLVYNYGTKLQAYAMQKLLEQNGDKCEIIQWHIRDFKILNPIVNYYKMIKKIYKGYGWKIGYWLKAMKRYHVLDNFNKKYHIKKYYGSFDMMKGMVSEYTHVFCGSDQAWLPDNVKHHWYTLEFCGKQQVKAAYAPSFGIDRIEDKYIDKYKSFLSNIDFISVRELSGKKIICNLIGKDVPVVLDPTLLLEKKDWDILMKEAKIDIAESPYVFCYFLGKNQKHRESVLKFSRKNGLKIVNMQHFSGYCKADEQFGDYNVYGASPQDFISLIANAKYVCTDSFHCTAFSIQYKKNFTVFHRFKQSDRGSTNTRLDSLLGQLGLKIRIVSDGQEVVEDIIDYNECDKKLIELRKISSSYLQEALSARKEI